MTALDPHLLEQAARVARAPRLLVAADYDGTLAAIVEDPAAAVPVAASVEALARLAELPATEVAVISGRGRDDLARLLGALPGVHLVGSHGGEFGPDFESSIPAEARHRLEDLERELRVLALELEGALVETKPASVAFHWRRADPTAAEPVVRKVVEGPAARPDVFVKHGKMVVELAVLAADKGSALARLRSSLDSAAVLFVGDDVTDEDAFRVLSADDLAVKVGSGETAAHHRISDPAEVAALLEAVLRRRREATSPRS